MGYRARWLAVKNTDVATCLAAMGLRQQASLDAEVVDPGLYCVALPGGWRVVMGDGWEFMDLVETGHARRLSKGTEALHLYTDDTTMSASLVLFRDGQELWSLSYDGSGGRSEPVVTGAPPPLVAQVIDECRAKQAGGTDDVDFLYEAAPQVAHALTGFRHDQTLASGDVRPILVLAQATPALAGEGRVKTDGSMVRRLKSLFGLK